MRALDTCTGDDGDTPTSAVIRSPSMSDGWGRFLQAVTRIPAGHPARSSRQVGSVTYVPSRRFPPAPSAGVPYVVGDLFDDLVSVWRVGEVNRSSIGPHDPAPTAAHDHQTQHIHPAESSQINDGRM